MRLFLTTSNLYKSAALAGLGTLMSAGRIVHGGMPPVLCISSMFLMLMFIAGAVNAWGRCAGMPGIATGRPTFLRGLLVVCILVFLILPIRIFWLDPVLKPAMLTADAAGRPGLAALAYPDAFSGRMALLLWSAGFQTLFMVAAPMALAARITGCWPVAIVVCIILRACICRLQAAEYGLAEHALLFAAAAVPASAIACWLFARFGLAPAMIFGAGIDLHVFFASSVSVTSAGQS